MTCRVFTLVLLMVPFAAAQAGSEASSPDNSVRIRVALEDANFCGSQTRVSLIDGAGPVIAEGFADSRCEVMFFNVPAGNYHVAVSRPGIADAGSGDFEIDSRRGQDVEVAVSSGESRPVVASTTPLVAVNDLKVPPRARKEFDKASELLAKNNLKKAMERLQRALSIDPDYAEAYNDLGVVYSRLGDKAQAREALQKAVSLNDHLAPAYVNLARLAIVDRDFPQAETLLNRATADDPDDAMILVLLANMELLNLHYDQALATCRRAHSLPHTPHAAAHYIAARVFEHEGRAAEALNQLRIFLAEEQAGPRAEAARKEMALLQAKLR